MFSSIRSLKLVMIPPFLERTPRELFESGLLGNCGVRRFEKVGDYNQARGCVIPRHLWVSTLTLVEISGNCIMTSNASCGSHMCGTILHNKSRDGLTMRRFMTLQSDAAVVPRNNVSSMQAGSARLGQEKETSFFHFWCDVYRKNRKNKRVGMRNRKNDLRHKPLISNIDVHMQHALTVCDIDHDKRSGTVWKMTREQVELRGQ